PSVPPFPTQRSSDLANLVFNRYLAESDDANLDGLRAFALFLSIRAAIRANVLFTQAERSTDQQAFDRAQKYLTLADSLIAPKPRSEEHTSELQSPDH